MKKKKAVSYKKHQERKRNIAGIKVIGIDPAKEKHQVTVLDEHSIQMGNSFSITVSHKGFNEEELNIRRISNGNHKADTLKKLKEYAHKSIGVGKTGEEDGVRMTLDAWISQLRLINANMKIIGDKMIELAKETEFFEILVSVPGISDISATSGEPIRD